MKKLGCRFSVFIRGVLVATLLCASLPVSGYAGSAGALSIDDCNSGLGLAFQPWEYTSKVVGCFRGVVLETVLNPANGFLIQISDFMVVTVGGMIVFAIMVFGMRIMGGEKNIKPKAIGFMLRIGLVWFFCYYLGNIGQYIFEVMDELICLVAMNDPAVAPPGTIYSEQTMTPGVLPTPSEIKFFSTGGVLQSCHPWNFIDIFVGKAFGFGEHVLLIHGLLGIVSAALLSSTVGILVFLTGFMALLDIIFMILRVIFIYLSSLLVAAFMIIISPFIIPMALFYTQERYFRRWLDTLLTAMFIPMIMFAFVGAFFGIYEILIDRLVNILGGFDAEGKTNFDAYWRLNQPKFAWLMPADPNLTQDFEVITRAENAGKPAVQTFINPYVRRAVDTNLFVAPGVDFGEAGMKIMQQLIFGFISLWIFSTLMKSMMRKIPEITQNIVGASLGITYQASSFESGVKKAMTSAQDAVKNSAGMGAAATVPRRRP